MNRSRFGPRTLTALLGTVAIVVAACGGTTTSTDPSATAAASAAAVETATPPPAVTPPPLAPDAPGPNGGVVISWFVGLGAGTQPAAAPGRGAVRQRLQRDAEGRLHRAGDPEQQRRRDRSSRPASRPATRRTSSGRSASRDSTSSATTCSTSRRSSRRPTTACPASTPSSSTSSSSGEDGATIGVPYAVYPSYLYFNKDLFDEAGLPYPPTKVGDLYDGKPWDMDAVRDPRHEADRRRGGQRRHQRELRPRPRSSSGASTRSTGRQQPAGRVGALRAGLVPGFRRQVRPDPRTSRPGRSGTTTASGRITSSPAPPRSAATCSTRATSSSRATWR